MKNPFVMNAETQAAFAAKAQPQFAEVVEYSGGKAKIRIDDRTQADDTYYCCIKSCVPAVGDRVFFVRTGGTILIIGVV
ncbi:hypothetical protein LJC56_10150 [Christensenellaceae bacterium OttesenSCG-928-K19]|nr:hypothetical protein [Christensenellaceae bacterium OttesenSCG-928-K19]